MRYAVELAIAQFEVAAKLAAEGLVADTVDVALCEDGRSISTHVYCGELCIVAPGVTLPRADPASFDRHAFSAAFLAALTARPRQHLN